MVAKTGDVIAFSEDMRNRRPQSHDVAICLARRAKSGVGTARSLVSRAGSCESAVGNRMKLLYIWYVVLKALP